MENDDLFLFLVFLQSYCWAIDASKSHKSRLFIRPMKSVSLRRFCCFLLGLIKFLNLFIVPLSKDAYHKSQLKRNNSKKHASKRDRRVTAEKTGSNSSSKRAIRGSRKRQTTTKSEYWRNSNPFFGLFTNGLSLEINGRNTMAQNEIDTWPSEGIKALTTTKKIIFRWTLQHRIKCEILLKK